MAVYLDFNASAPVDSRVLDRMLEVYRFHYGNADSRTHQFGADATELVSSSRRAIADILRIDSADILFTSGATESNNMAITGLLKYARKSGKTHFITSEIEHKSILESMKYLQRHGCQVDFIRPDESGRIRPEEILSLINDKTLLVSIMLANNETGVIQPVDEIGSALENSGVYFHIDATQGFGKLNDTLRRVRYDMMSFNAHKIGGPQGIGAFVFKRDRFYQRPPITPLMYGGSQERGYRPGTTPVALVVGFALAAELCEKESAAALEKCHEIKRNFLEAMRGTEYRLNGDQAHCLPTTINISFSGVDAEGIFLAMKENYAFSNGSACNSGSYEPSYVLKAMGLDEQRINEAVRISWNAQTVADFSELAAYVRNMQS